MTSCDRDALVRVSFLLMFPPLSRSTLFPYTTLFRSDQLAHHQCERLDRRKQYLGDPRFLLFDHGAENHLPVHQNREIHDEPDTKHENETSTGVAFLTGRADLD